MKIKLYALCFFLILCSSLSSQILEIEEITVSRVILKTKDIIQEDEEDGPSVYFNLVIKNNTDSVLILTPSQSKIRLLFRYMGRDYAKRIVPAFFEEKSFILQKGKQISINLGENILHGTDLLDSYIRGKGYDYTKKMMQILPTCRIEYQDKDIIIKSTVIESVKLKDFVYTP